MAYPPRQGFEGAVFHVVTRGNNREPIFADDVDRRRFLDALKRYTLDFHFSVLAYALMSNHIHLVMQQDAVDPLSRFMQALTIKYTKYFNRRHDRVGHVFQGRFRSRLIQTDAYLLVASRYVHLNPVKAGLTDHPSRYSWSSYTVYMEGRDARGLVRPELVLSLMGVDPTEQSSSYRDFVETQWPHQRAEALRGSRLQEAWDDWVAGPTALRLDI